MSKAIKCDHCFFIVSFLAFTFCRSQTSFLLRLFKRSWRRWTKLVANPGSRAGVQKLGFASSSQMLCLPLWPDNNKDEIQKLYYFFFYLNVGKGCTSTLLDPHYEKITAIQHCFAQYNLSLPIYRQPSILEMDTFGFAHLRGAKSWHEPCEGAASASHLPRHGAAETPWMPFCTGGRFNPFKFILASSPFPIQSWHPPPQTFWRYQVHFRRLFFLL